jgi:hypothetical protein
MGIEGQFLGIEGELLEPVAACVQDAPQPANPLCERVSVAMELAGLEPATSWVRFKSAAAWNPHHERVSDQSSGGEPLGYLAVARGFWG